MSKREPACRSCRKRYGAVRCGIAIAAGMVKKGKYKYEDTSGRR